MHAPPEYIYIHIPFCIGKCAYCDFLSIPIDDDLADKYVDALVSEIRLCSRRQTLKTIYLGGGTPSILPVEAFRKIFNALDEGFIVTGGTEITIEANPGTIDNEKASALRSLGINRVSIGIQSFNDDELKTLGRRHTAKDAVDAVDAVRSAGIDNVSIDLMYAIPGQAMASWQDSMDKAVALNTKHISAYELTLEEGTPIFEAVKKGDLSLPGEDEAIKMAVACHDKLSKAGFEHYEISNYAKHGMRSLHNMNYWQRGAYLGLGAGAHGFNSIVRTKNSGDIRKYIDLLSTGKSAVETKETIDGASALRERVFLALRTSNGIDIKALGLNIDMNAVDDLLREGLIEETRGHGIRLTLRGMMLCNPVTLKVLEAMGL